MRTAKRMGAALFALFLAKGLLWLAVAGFTWIWAFDEHPNCRSHAAPATPPTQHQTAQSPSPASSLQSAHIPPVLLSRDPYPCSSRPRDVCMYLKGGILVEP